LCEVVHTEISTCFDVSINYCDALMFQGSVRLF
jgi:hypothetical protein